MQPGGKALNNRTADQLAKTAIEYQVLNVIRMVQHKKETLLSTLPDDDFDAKWRGQQWFYACALQRTHHDGLRQGDIATQASFRERSRKTLSRFSAVVKQEVACH